MAEATPGTLVLDFDGTVTATDSQKLLFRRFIPDRWEAVDQAWRRGEMTAGQRAERQWALLPVGPDQALSFLLEAVRLSPGTRALVDEAEGRGWTVTVVSDGFRFYIDPLLEKHGLDGLAVEANDLSWTEGSEPRVVTLGQHPVCDRCANCKLCVVRAARAAGGPVVMVGDGRADRGGALWADRVFAKEHLEEYCRLWDIEHDTFGTLEEVRAALAADGWRVPRRELSPPHICPDARVEQGIDPGWRFDGAGDAP